MALKIDQIEGIGPSYRAKLAECGIKTTDQLLEACQTPAGRKKFAEQPVAFFGRLERFLRSVPPVDPTRVAAWKASIDGW